MKRLLLLLLCIYGFHQAAFAQPTFSMPCPLVVDTGEEVCIPVTVLDFTAILGTEFTLGWDEDVLQYQSVGNFNPAVTGLDATDFDASGSGVGVLLFDWDNGTNCATSQIAVTLPDNEVLFEICFIATGVLGNFSQVEFLDAPLEKRVTRVNSNCNDIGCFVDAGCVSIALEPLTLIIPEVTANDGETVCVDINVEDFDEMVSLQFSVAYNDFILTYESYSGIPQLFVSDPFAGQLIVSWGNTTGGCLSLPDGDALVTLCFTVDGNCGQNSFINVTDDPTPRETVRCAGEELGILAQNGRVTVNCTDPDGLSLTLPDATVDPGQSFCMDVTVADFSQINQLAFSINWNENILQLDDVTNIAAGLFLFNSAIDDSGAANGFLTVDWGDSGFGSSLADDAVLFSLCFTAVGSGTSPVTFSGSPEPINIGKLGDPSIGLNGDNGLVVVNPLPSITLISSNETVSPGQLVTVDITAQNFEDIIDLETSIFWENGVLEFVQLLDFNLPGLDAGDFNTSFANFGTLCIDWASANTNGHTVPDNAVLFRIQFEAVGNALECTQVDFGDSPCPTLVTTAEANGNVGINGVAGVTCLDNPDELTFRAGSANGAPGSQRCVDVTAEGFTNINAFTLSVNWNAAELTLTDVIDGGSLFSFSNSSYDNSQAPTGILQVDYNNTAGNGETLTDGTVLFTLCYIISPDLDGCSPVAITDNPLDRAASLDVAPAQTINASSTDGEICLNAAAGIVGADITQESCPGTADGAVDLTVTGGSGQYSYLWDTPGGTEATEDLSDLSAGTVSVTVIDVSNPIVELTATYEVPLNPDAPRVFLAADTTLNCGDPTLRLCGQPGTAEGTDVTYAWTVESGGGTIFEGQDSICAVILGSGTYRLCVTQDNCTTCDEIEVVNAAIPAAVASTSGSIDCTDTPAQISGFGSTENEDFIYEWIAVGGSGIVPGSDTALQVLVSEPGQYLLQITDPSNNCTGVSDTVTVIDNTFPPTAAVAQDTVRLGCANPSADLDGTPSSQGGNYGYEWQDPLGDPIAQTITATTTEAGLHALIVTDTNNSCADTAFVFVDSDTDLPTANAGNDRALTCDSTSVTLNGTMSTQGDGFSYLWTTACGATITNPTSLTPTVSEACTYILEVTNDATGCKATSMVTVSSEIDPPAANITPPASQLTCAISSVTLDGAGSAEGQHTYVWSEATGAPIADPTALSINATAPGTYVLTVTDTITGCSNATSYSLTENTNAPGIFLTAPTDTLTCETEEIVLSAAGSGTGPNVVYTYTGPDCTALLPQSDGTVNLSLTCPGMYQLLVRDTVTQCADSLQLEIFENTDAPIADAGADQELGCGATSAFLDGSGSSQGDGLSYLWTPFTPGTIVAGTETTLSPEVTAPGTFGLVVTDENNGCTANAAVNVTESSAADAEAGDDVTSTCDEPSVVLMGSSDTPDATYLWTALDGGTIAPGEETTLTPTVTGAGTYQLEVTTADGCGDTDTVEVLPDDNAPNVDAGADQELPCGTPELTLDGSGATGDGISYAWTTDDGTISGAADALSVTVSSAGTYVLTITNEATGCEAVDAVVVTDILPGEVATAEADGDGCGESVFLTANLPDGLTGLWTSTNGATFDDATAPITFATSNGTGQQSFTWTLSAPGCPDYSTATATFTPTGTPVAVNDNYDLPADLDSVLVTPLLNDTFDPDSAVTVTIINDPGLGTISDFDPTDGSFYYAQDTPGFNGPVQLTYELCSAACPNTCATGLIIITVTADPEVPVESVLPNAITPNGDGLNDALIFDELLAAPDIWPNNELVIFNRWGDAVFRAAPYQNDWMGTNQNGQDLPQATYYYILTLDVSEGEIIRGDVTVLK